MQEPKFHAIINTGGGRKAVTMTIPNYVHRRDNIFQLLTNPKLAALYVRETIGELPNSVSPQIKIVDNKTGRLAFR